MSKTVMDVIVNCCKCGMQNECFTKGQYRQEILQSLEVHGWKEVLGRGYICPSCYRKWRREYSEPAREKLLKSGVLRDQELPKHKKLNPSNP